MMSKQKPGNMQAELSNSIALNEALADALDRTKARLAAEERRSHALEEAYKACQQDAQAALTAKAEAQKELDTSRSLMHNLKREMDHCLTANESMLSDFTNLSAALQSSKSSISQLRKDKHAALKERDDALNEKEAILKAKEIVEQGKLAAIREKEEAQRLQVLIEKQRDEAVEFLEALQRQAEGLVKEKAASLTVIHNREMSAVRSQLEEALGMLREVVGEHSNMQHELQHRTTAFQEAQTRWESERNVLLASAEDAREVATQLSMFRSQWKATGEENNALKHELQQTGLALESLRNTHASLVASLPDLDERMAAERAEAAEKLSAAERRAAQSEAHIHTLQQEHAQLLQTTRVHAQEDAEARMAAHTAVLSQEMETRLTAFQANKQQEIEQLQARITSLLATLQAAATSEADLRQEVQSLQQCNELQEGTLQQMRQQADAGKDAHHKEVLTLQSRIVEQEGIIQQLQTEKDGSSCKHTKEWEATIQQQLQEQEHEIQVLNEQLAVGTSEALASASKSAKELQTANEAAGQLQLEHETTLQQLSAYQTLVQRLQTEVSVRVDDAQASQHRVADVRDDFNVLQVETKSRLMQFEADIMQDTAASFQAALTAVETAWNTKLQQVLADAQTEKAALKVSAHTGHEELQQRVHFLEQRETELVQELEELDHALVASGSNLQLVTTNSIQVTAQLQTTLQALEMAQTENGQLRNGLQHLEELRLEAKRDAERMEAVASHANSECLHLRTALETEAGTLQRELNAAREVAMQLEEELTTAKLVHHELQAVHEKVKSDLGLQLLDLQTRFTMLARQHDEACAALDTARVETAELVMELQSRQERVDVLEGEERRGEEKAAALTAELNAEITTLRTSLESAEHQSTLLVRECMGACAAVVEEWRGEERHIKERLQGYADRISQCTSLIALLSKSQPNLQALEDATAECVSWKAQYKNAISAVDELIARCETLQRDLTHSEAREQEQQQSYLVLTSQYEQLQVELRASVAAGEELEAEGHAYEAKLQVVQQAIQSALADKQVYVDKWTAAQVEMNKLNVMIQQLPLMLSEDAAAEDRLAHASKQLSTQAEERTRIEGLQQHVAALEEALRGREEEIESSDMERAEQLDNLGMAYTASMIEGLRTMGFNWDESLTMQLTPSDFVSLCSELARLNRTNASDAMDSTPARQPRDDMHVHTGSGSGSRSTGGEIGSLLSPVTDAEETDSIRLRTPATTDAKKADVSFSLSPTPARGHSFVSPLSTPSQTPVSHRSFGVLPEQIARATVLLASVIHLRQRWAPLVQYNVSSAEPGVQAGVSSCVAFLNAKITKAFNVLRQLEEPDESTPDSLIAAASTFVVAVQGAVSALKALLETSSAAALIPSTEMESLKREPMDAIITVASKHLLQAAEGGDSGARGPEVHIMSVAGLSLPRSLGFLQDRSAWEVLMGGLSSIQLSYLEDT
jgi:chromosome segregation ATPase